MTAARANGLVDRDPQNLPVPLGGMAPVRARRPRRRGARRAQLTRTFVVLAVITAAIGLVLLLVPSPVAVSLFGDRVEVGGMVLREQGTGGGAQPLRFDGDASYVLSEHGDGSASAAAVWLADGTRSSGVCTLRPERGRLIDECTFTSGATRLTSVDLLDPATGEGWQRTYADGSRVAIAVSPNGSAVPVPFPIGH